MSDKSGDGSTPDELNPTEAFHNGIDQNSDTPGGKDTKIPPEASIDDSDPDMGCNGSKTSDDQSADHDQQDTKKKSTSENSKRTMDGEDSHDSRQDSHSKSLRRSRITTTFDDSDEENGGASSSWAKRDIDDYRNGYPGMKSNSKFNDNYHFYTNKIASDPDGDFIDEIHKKWYGRYSKLEYHHGFIQWLFPLREQGLNWSAQPLQLHEIKKMKEDPAIMKRLVKSFELMLDFYGFELVDRDTGKIKRSSQCNYKERFDNLNTSSHNYLRITRILKCLGEFGYENMKFGFLVAILREAIQEHTLHRCLNSCRDYWIETLRDPKHRRIIRKYARELIQARNEGTPSPSAPTFKISTSGGAIDPSDNQME